MAKSNYSIQYISISEKRVDGATVEAVDVEAHDEEEALSVVGVVGLANSVYLDYRYWALHTALIIVEPILCSRDTPDRPGVRISEIIIMAVSTLLLLVQVILLSKRTWTALRANRRWSSISAGGNAVMLRNYIEVMLTNDHVSLQTPGVLIEVACLLCGWVFIFPRPGVAVLRCFRVFRMLFYYEDLPSGVRKSIDEILGSTFSYRDIIMSRTDADILVQLCYKVMYFGGFTLKQMAREMFMLDRKTRGGFILVVILFYSGWVLGIASWIDVGLDAADVEMEGTESTAVNCNDVHSCLSSVYRLSMWDTKGFDFLWSLRGSKDKFLFAVLVVYMCGTAFGVLNGLTGIFRNIYTKSSRRAFVKNSKEEEVEEESMRRSFRRKRAGLRQVAAGISAMKMQMADIASEVEALCERRSETWKDSPHRDTRDSAPPLLEPEIEVEQQSGPPPAPPVGFRAELVDSPPPSPRGAPAPSVAAAAAAAIRERELREASPWSELSRSGRAP